MCLDVGAISRTWSVLGVIVASKHRTIPRILVHDCVWECMSETIQDVEIKEGRGKHRGRKLGQVERVKGRQAGNEVVMHTGSPV